MKGDYTAFSALFALGRDKDHPQMKGDYTKSCLSSKYPLTKTTPE